MLTAVMLLLLPAVLGMSVMRQVQLPRDLWAGRARISARRRLLCALARALWTPPRTIHELFAVAYAAVAYPLVYLAFEWVLYYSVKPASRA